MSTPKQYQLKEKNYTTVKLDPNHYVGRLQTNNDATAALPQIKLESKCKHIAVGHM